MLIYLQTILIEFKVSHKTEQLSISFVTFANANSKANGFGGGQTNDLRDLKLCKVK
jgi:hypothetical protein